jgi:predicted dehydrogenase
MKIRVRISGRGGGGSEVSRRDFIGCAASVFTILPRHVVGGVGWTPPSEKIRVAGIGVGGMGGGDLEAIDATGMVDIAALCDVDDERAAKSFVRWPAAPRYRDFRRMFDAEHSHIDAVVVGTPDHVHAPATLAAINHGKSVYCEKPLTHSIDEARKIAAAARESGVVTQMGNQGHSGEGIRLTREWIRDGAIGRVTEVHVWCNTGGSGATRPADTPPVPRTLDWDLWLGPSPWRPYNPAYLPGKWRSWWDFGTGPVGDFGLHLMDVPIWALDLGPPSTVEAETTPVNQETAPAAATIIYEFPARGEQPPVKLVWYDGGRKPPRPEELEPDREMNYRYGGMYFVGDRGKLVVGCYGESPRLIPEERMKAYKRPPQTLPRCKGHHEDWVQACKTGEAKRPSSRFDWSGPMVETVLLGNVAIRVGRKFSWDASGMRAINTPEADLYIQSPYRSGWKL